MPHHLALFSLVAGNERAVVEYPANRHLVSTLRDGTPAFEVGFHIHGKESKTLASLGRHRDVDIFVDGSSISRLQCTFEIEEANVVMLYDRSYGGTTQVMGQNATPFEHGRSRKVLVQKDLNTMIGMGGERRDLVRFKLVWHQSPEQSTTAINQFRAMSHKCIENPRLSRTVEDGPTVPPSQRITRLHTPRPDQMKMRYLIVGDELGSGQFGQVYKAIDVDSAKVMAVKILRSPTKQPQGQLWRVALHYALKHMRNI